MNTEADMNTEANMNTAAEMNADMIGTTDDDSKTETEAAAEAETDTEKGAFAPDDVAAKLEFPYAVALAELELSAAITEKYNVACLCCYH